MSDAPAVAAPKRARPLSPHLQIYRPQLTSFLSITHRATGVALSVGTLMLLCWVVSAATSYSAYNDMQAFMRSPIGMVLLMGWSWSLLFHLCTGVRHLVWDTGKGLELKPAYCMGYGALIISTLLTLAVWALAWGKLS